MDDAVSYCIYCTLPVVKYASWPGADWTHQATGSKWCRLSVATVRESSALQRLYDLRLERK